ncbi:MAG: hypothetical protein FWG31_08360 [Oscillospiraceae bacterium]|nr:hypothetical protein [Oscillospiraceae bacterium]
MRIQPIGFTFFRDGRVMPRHIVAEDPAIRNAKLPSISDDGFRFTSPKLEENGAVPRLTLYSARGEHETIYFGSNYGKQPKTRAEAVEKAMGGESCELCKTRKYQDGGHDSGVSFNSPQHIAPENAASVVRSHEREHLTNAAVNAEKLGHRVAYSTVRLFSSCCSECGRMYISGGQAETKTVEKPGYTNIDSGLRGQYIDIAV